MAFEWITSDPGRLGGVPTVRDTWVTASKVLGRLEAGRTIDEVLADYPDLGREGVRAALEYAAAVTRSSGLP